MPANTGAAKNVTATAAVVFVPVTLIEAIAGASRFKVGAAVKGQKGK